MGDNFYKVNEDGTIDKIDGANNNGKEDKNEPLTGFFVGLGTSLLGGIFCAIIMNFVGEELIALVLLFCGIAGLYPACYVKNTVIGCIYGCLFCVLAYIVYILVLELLFGSGYSDGTFIDTADIIGCAILGLFGGGSVAKK